MSAMQYELRRFQTIPARRQMRLFEIKVSKHWKTANLAYTFVDCRFTLTRNAKCLLASPEC